MYFKAFELNNSHSAFLKHKYLFNSQYACFSIGKHINILLMFLMKTTIHVICNFTHDMILYLQNTTVFLIHTFFYICSKLIAISLLFSKFNSIK